MSKALVIGAGYVGGALRPLLAPSFAATLVRRKVTTDLASSERAFSLDLNTAAPWPADLSSANYDVGFILVPPRVGQETPSSSYPELAKRCVRELKVHRWILASSTSVYGEPEKNSVTMDVDENSPTPTNSRSRFLLEAEEIILKEGGDVLRFSGIYGEGRTRLIHKMLDGTVDRSSLGQWTNRIHVSDCARALHFLATRNIAPGLWVGSDDRPATYFEVLSFIAQTLNQTGRVTPDVLMAPEQTYGRRCLNRKLKGAGFEFSVPSFVEGYGRLVRELKESKAGDWFS